MRARRSLRVHAQGCTLPRVHEPDPRWLEGAALCAALAGIETDEVVAAFATIASERLRASLSALRAPPTRELRAHALVQAHRAMLGTRRRVTVATGAGARVARAMLVPLAPTERPAVARRLPPTVLAAASHPDTMRAVSAAPPLAREESAHLLHAFTARVGRGPTESELDELAYLLAGGSERVGSVATGVARSLRARGVDLSRVARCCALIPAHTSRSCAE